MPRIKPRRINSKLIPCLLYYLSGPDFDFNPQSVTLCSTGKTKQSLYPCNWGICKGLHSAGLAWILKLISYLVQEKLKIVNVFRRMDT